MTDRATITKRLPQHFAPAIRDVLRSFATDHQRVTFVDDGKFPFTTFTITVPSSLADQLRERLDEGESDEMSREAW